MSQGYTLSGYPLKLLSGNATVTCSNVSGVAVLGGLTTDTFAATAAANAASVGAGQVYTTTLLATGQANVASLRVVGAANMAQVFSNTITTTGAANLAQVYATTLQTTGAANAASLGVGAVYATTVNTTGNLAVGGALTATGRVTFTSLANTVALLGLGGAGSTVNLDMSTYGYAANQPALRWQAVDTGAFTDTLNLLQSNGTVQLSRLYLNPAGQFGFGTTSPGHIIDVQGNVRASNSLIANTAVIANTATVGNLVTTTFSANTLAAGTLTVSGTTTTSGNVNVVGDVSATGNVTAVFLRGSNGAVAGNVFTLTIPLSGDHEQTWFKCSLPAAQTFNIAIAPAADANASNYNYSMFSSTGGATGGYTFDGFSQFSSGVVIAANCAGSSAQHWVNLTSISGLGTTTQVDVVVGGTTANNTGTYRNSGTIQYAKAAANLQVLFQTAAATGANVRYGTQPVNYL